MQQVIEFQDAPTKNLIFLFFESITMLSKGGNDETDFYEYVYIYNRKSFVENAKKEINEDDITDFMEDIFFAPTNKYYHILNNAEKFSDEEIKQRFFNFLCEAESNIFTCICVMKKYKYFYGAHTIITFGYNVLDLINEEKKKIETELKKVA